MSQPQAAGMQNVSLGDSSTHAPAVYNHMQGYAFFPTEGNDSLWVSNPYPTFQY
ncbi:hypothetical protein AN958_00026 [Leucoagaricus sp. SymC.cos]|nr:hypothetical protein AN958_00026 [Leucoagaricus sp. SymC.cos]